MPNQGVKTYRAGNVEWVCGLCGHTNADVIESDSARLPEFEHYQNYQFQCENCNGFIFINMNIPESEYEEFDLEVEHMDFFEINARKQIRDLIYEHREDMKSLKKKDKEAKREAKKEKAAHWRDQLHGQIMAEKTVREGKKKFREKKEKEKKDKGAKV